MVVVKRKGTLAGLLGAGVLLAGRAAAKQGIGASPDRPDAASTPMRKACLRLGQVFTAALTSTALIALPSVSMAATADTLAITPYDATAPLTTLTNAIQAANPGITILTSTFIGIAGQSGTYTGFDLSSSTPGEPTITAPNGVLLTNGSADLPLTNTSTEFSHVTGTGANAQLTALVGAPTYDQNVLTLTFTVANPSNNAIQAGFVFGTDEYPEYIATYNDTIGFFVDGQNYAAFPNGSLVSINPSTVSNFNDNATLNSGGTTAYGLEYDGISNLLTVNGLLDPTLTTHTLTIAIADINDEVVDSGVFIGGLQATSMTGGGGIVTSGPTIDTARGDIAPNIFSLGSPAANASVVEFDGGTLRLTGGNFAGNIITAPVTIDATNGTVDTSTGNGGFSGIVSGPGSLTIVGGGTFSLTGVNTYAGGTILDAATVAVGNNAALGTGAITFNAGSLQATVDGLSLANAAVLSGNGTIDTQAFGLTYAGVISGAGALAKDGTGTLALTAANTYTGGTLLTAGAIQVGNAAALGTGALTFNGGALQAGIDGLTLTNAATLAQDGTIDTQAFGLTYAGVISGPGVLTKAGSGTLALTEANTYAGGTSLAGGVVALGTSSALGSGAVTFNGGALQAGLDGLVLGNVLALAQNGTIDTQGFGLIASGVISGPGVLTKVGSGTLALTGANTYAGGTSLAGGVVALGNSSALGSGVVTFNGGALQAGLDGLALGNALVLAQNGTIDTQGFGLTASGAISGPGVLTKAGSGTLALTAANSYAGGTALQAGTILVGNASALGTGAVTFAGGALQAGVDGLTLTNAAVLAGNGTIDTQAFGLTLAGPVSGSGTLTKVGSGTLALTAANSFTGGTALDAGAIVVGDAAALGTGALSFNGGALQAGVDGLKLGNTIVLAQNGTIDTQGFGLTAAGVISGAGALSKLGSGALVLTAANTYTGGTVLGAGAVTVGNGAALGTGTVTFAGGALQAGANGLTLGNAVVLAHDGTIDTQDFGLTQSGVVSGAGLLTKIGSGTLALAGNNTYAGGTALTAGAVAVSSSAALGTGTVTFAGGALQAGTNGLTLGNAAVLSHNGIIDTQAFGLIYAGAISGTGALTKTGSGILGLTGANSYAGGTQLSAGTLIIDNGAALGTGALRIDEGTRLLFDADLSLDNAVVFTGIQDPTIDTGSHNDTMAGIISGPGALTKQGSGTLTLTADNTYTGPTTIAAGTLAVLGADPGSAVTIAGGAALAGTGTVGGVTAQTGSTLAPGSAASPYGTLTVAGSMTLTAGSTVQLQINPAGQSSSVAVSGTAVLGSAALLLVNAPGSYNPGTSYAVLTAAGGLSGTFASVSTATPLAFVTPTLVYGPNAVTVALQQNAVSFPSVGVTQNQVNVAKAIQGLGPGSALYNAILNLTPAQARQAFDAASGSVHASTNTAAFEDAHHVGTLVFDRLWNIGGGELDARQLLDKLAPNDLPTFVRCFGPVEPAPKPVPTVYSVWGEGFGDFGHDGGNGNGNGATLERSLGGFVFGLDAPIHGLGAPYRIGVAAGYSDDTFGGEHASSSGTYQSVFGSIYGGTRYGAVDIRLAASVSGNQNDVRRTVAFPGFYEVERSSYGGSTVQGFGEVGYRFASPRFVVEPVVGAAITYVHQDAYREVGGAAALTGAAQDNAVGTTTVGLRTEAAPFTGVPIVARAFLGWRHAFGDISPASRLAFEAGSVPFASTGAPVDTDALAAEAGLDWRYSSTVSLALSYLGQYGARDYDNGVKGRAEYKF